MKFNCGESYEVWYKRLTNWHRHFALIPVRLGDEECRWLEYVERKGTLLAFGHGWVWDYRAAKGTK